MMHMLLREMNLLLEQRWVLLLGWSLVHFLWQGTLIAFVFAAVRALFSNVLSANARYVLACAALAAMTIVPILTGFELTRAGGGGTLPGLWPTIPLRDWQRLLPLIVTAWFIGVAGCSGRLIGGWRLASRMRSTAVEPPPAEWRQMLEDLVLRMGAWRPVRLLVSSLVEVPTLVGWLRPVILMPAHALTGMPPEHITALLAHELAHICRHDYLANMLQSVAEALLFYHPAVWWVSSQIRAERELCCDDMAIAVCGGDVLTYARALAEIESLRPTHANVALAANGGALVNRIRRLMGERVSLAQSLPGREAVWSLVLLWLGIGVATMHGSTVPPATLPSPVPRSAISALAIPVPGASASAHPLRSAAISAVLFDPFFDPAPSAAEPMPSTSMHNPVDNIVDGSEPPDFHQTVGPSPLAELRVPTSSISVRVADVAPTGDPLPFISPPSSPVIDAPPSAESPVIRSEKRLIEVEVVVRDKNGPVKGLTKDDFTLLQGGKLRSIAVVHARTAEDVGRTTMRSEELAPGGVSNRQSNIAAPMSGSTAILIDQLHARFDLSGYMRQGTIKLIQALSQASSPTALYSLGKSLHPLLDFSDSSRKLTENLAESNGRSQPRGLSSAFNDYGDLILDNGGFNNVDVDGHATIGALKQITERLSRQPGRRNLVWLMDQPNVPLPVMEMIRQANIVLYPVMLHGGQHRALEILAGVTGGRAFFDVMDLPSAMKLAEEDSANAYVLSYYPAGGDRVEDLSVKLKNKSFEVRARPAYFATAGIDTELVRSSLDLTSVGLTAQIRPDSAGLGLNRMRLTVDLHNIHLEPNGDRMEGAFDLVLLTNRALSARSLEVRLDLKKTEWQRALETGYTMNIDGIDGGSEDLRVAVRDRATGAVGSLRFPSHVNVLKASVQSIGMGQIQ